MEFFLDFFDLVGKDIWKVVEESRVNGMVSRVLNKIFIDLIPKSSNQSSFSYFRPISLSNLVYKVIDKVIACRIRGFLSQDISKENLCFLQNRQILDSIGVAKEAINSIKVKKLDIVILN